MEDIVFVFRESVPQQVSDEIVSMDLQGKLGLQVNIKRVRPKMSHFDGPEFIDIVILLGKEAIPFISSELMPNAIYDLIKEAVLKIWKGLAGSKSKEPKFHIELKEGDRSVLIQIPVNAPKEKMGMILESAFKAYRQKELDTAFHNPETVTSDNGKPKIRVVYNKTTGTWEPRNFVQEHEAFKKRMDEMEKNMRFLS